MDILQTIASKVEELGTQTVLDQLGVTNSTYSSWFYKGTRKKEPTFSIAQKAMDLWGNGNGSVEVNVKQEATAEQVSELQAALEQTEAEAKPTAKIIQKPLSEVMGVSSGLTKVNPRISPPPNPTQKPTADPQTKMQAPNVKPINQLVNVFAPMPQNVPKAPAKPAVGTGPVVSDNGFLPPSKSVTKKPEVIAQAVPQHKGSKAEVNGDALHIVVDAPKTQPNWTGRDVCLCLPIYDQVPYEFFFTVASLIMKYRDALWLNSRGSDSMIARSRNHLAKRFLETGATWSIWFDSDMCFPMGHGGIYKTITGMENAPNQMLELNTIDRLLSWKKSIVGGCYWDRRGSGKLIAGSRQPILHMIPKNVLQPVDFVGTGCLAVHRQVFLDIAAKFPETMSPDSMGNECGFFTPMNTPQRMLGEDEAFAKRAADAGHTSFLDLGLLCGHVGRGVHGLPPKGSKI